MITIQNFMETVNYRITEGSDYLWKCFGDHAYRLDSWDGEHDNGVSVSMVFDRQTQVVYQMDSHDYGPQRSYRWTHPDHVAAHRQEVVEKLGSVDRDVAYDDVKFVEITEARDMLEKSQSIVNHKPYDTRVQVPIDLYDDELFRLMKMAHEQDITLNQLVEQIIARVIETHHASSQL